MAQTPRPSKPCVPLQSSSASPPSPPAPGRRGVHLTGTVAAMQSAFGVRLEQQTHDGATYRVREGAIQLPASSRDSSKPCSASTTALRPSPTSASCDRSESGQANASSITLSHATSGSFTPVQVAQLYQFPANASAAGQTIGLIELGGGYRTADITAYFKSLGQKAPKVTAVSVDEGKNAPSNANSADGEVMLDIEVAAAVAPGANIAVYFAPNTDQGFIDAISTAVHDTTNKPSVISISWGAPSPAGPSSPSPRSTHACQSAAALGVTITVASGDNGSTDGVTGATTSTSPPPARTCSPAAAPSSSPTAPPSPPRSSGTSNPATKAQPAAASATSSPLPTWQATAKVPAPSGSTGGRGVPDVAGDADPNTGYTVRVDGQTIVIGGTSAVAPLWAGLIAVANAAEQEQPPASSTRRIYAAKAQGWLPRHHRRATTARFSAGPGWDACTGLGSPVATRLIPLLSPSATPSKPTKGKGKKKSPKPPAKGSKK